MTPSEQGPSSSSLDSRATGLGSCTGISEKPRRDAGPRSRIGGSTPAACHRVESLKGPPLEQRLAGSYVLSSRQLQEAPGCALEGRG